MDAGSIEDFYKTSSFVEAIENRQGLKIACIEEIAFFNKWISKKEIKECNEDSMEIAIILKYLQKLL